MNVKGRQVDGGFLAKMRSGHEGIYRRVGKDRFPIKESTLKMRASASVVLQRLLPLAEAELEKKLKQELNYEMHRKMGAV